MTPRCRNGPRYVIALALLLVGCDDSWTNYTVRHNLCIRRGPGWHYVTGETTGDVPKRLDSMRCVHVDSIAPRDSVVLP